MTESNYNRNKISATLVLALCFGGLGLLWRNHQQNFMATPLTPTAQEQAGQILGQAAGATKINLVTASAFSEALNNEPEAVLLDIRRPEEISQVKIAGAIELNFEASDFAEQLNALDRSKHYYLYCNSGNRSASAAQMMEQLGFEQITELRGGIQSWMGGGLPTCRNC